MVSQRLSSAWLAARTTQNLIFPLIGPTPGYRGARWCVCRAGVHICSYDQLCTLWDVVGGGSGVRPTGRACGLTRLALCDGWSVRWVECSVHVRMVSSVMDVIGSMITFQIGTSVVRQK